MSKHRDRRESQRSEWSDEAPKDFQEPSFFRQRPAVAPPRAAPQAEAASEAAGTVKFYNSDKGFGFIGLDDGGKDVFVHVSTLSPSGIAGLEQGQAVWVTYALGSKGLEARSVRLG